MASNSVDPDRIDPEQLESARKAMKSSSPIRLINLILQVLQKRYLERRAPVSFSGILQLLELSDMKEHLRSDIKRLLLHNPKIKYEPRESLFSFKPTLEARSTKDLRKLLQSYESYGLGGILLSEVREAIPNCDSAVERLKDDMIEVATRDKADKAFFYKNKELTIELDESFNALWRSISVEGISGVTIESELRKVDVDVLKGATDNSQERGIKRKARGRDGGKKRRAAAHVSNTHLEKGYLHDYRSLT